VELTCTRCGHVQRGTVRSTMRAVACRECNARIEIAPSEDDAIAELVKRAGGADS
jgi:DNA-directed RNA polymerase subunit RPC12/RpoP